MNRRGFLTGMAGILAAGYSASVLPSGVIMPIRQLWTPTREIIVSAASIREIDYLTITNKSSMAHTISGMFVVNNFPLQHPPAGETIAIRAVIKETESLHYESGRGWYVCDENGNIAA